MHIDFIGLLDGSIEDLQRVYHPPQPYPWMSGAGIWTLGDYSATAIDEGERLIITWSYKDQDLARISWNKDNTIPALANIIVTFLLAFAKAEKSRTL